MAASATATVGTKGIVRQVIGPVLDVEFPAGKLPSILNALRIEGTKDPKDLGERRVRKMCPVFCSHWHMNLAEVC